MRHSINNNRGVESAKQNTNCEIFNGSGVLGPASVLWGRGRLATRGRLCAFAVISGSSVSNNNEKKVDFNQRYIY